MNELENFWTESAKKNKNLQIYIFHVRKQNV